MAASNVRVSVKVAFGPCAVCLGIPPTDGRYPNAYPHLSSFLLSKSRSSGVYQNQAPGLRKSSRVFAVDNQHHGPKANDAVARTTDRYFRVHEAGRI